MTGTTKAILSISVLLLAALVVYYGMTPEQQSNYISADVPTRGASIETAVFGGDPYDKAAELGLLTKLKEETEQVTTDVRPVGQELWTPPAPVLEVIEEPVEVAVEDKPEFYLYTVKEGETLGEIATREMGGFSKWHWLADYNEIRDPSSIRPGRVLRIPTPMPETTPELVEPWDGDGAGAGVEIVDMTNYIIQDGDTLSSIAESHFGNANLYRVILDANPSLDSRRLQIGKTIKIPVI